MSTSRFFYEPFCSLSEFDRLFDDAFNARTGGTHLQRHNADAIVPNVTKLKCVLRMLNL